MSDAFPEDARAFDAWAAAHLEGWRGPSAAKKFATGQSCARIPELPTDAGCRFSIVSMYDISNLAQGIVIVTAGRVWRGVPQPKRAV